MSDDKKGALRARWFTFLMWQESAPDNWVQLLDDLHIMALVSPLHDSDVYDNDGKDYKKGDKKKSHWHVLLTFNGTKSVQQVLDILEVGGIKLDYVQIVHNTVGTVRYFCHLDNPEKAQYKIRDLKTLCGFPLQKYLYSGEILYSMLKMMCAKIKEMHCQEYMTFFTYCMTEHFDDWFPVLVDNINVNNIVNRLIQSQRYAVEKRVKKRISDSGHIINEINTIDKYSSIEDVKNRNVAPLLQHGAIDNCLLAENKLNELEKVPF